MTGMPNFLQYLSNKPLIVELNTRPFTNIGLSAGKPLITSENFIIVCQSSCIFLTDDLFFVGKNPPSPL